MDVFIVSNYLIYVHVAYDTVANIILKLIKQMPGEIVYAAESIYYINITL